MDSSSRTGAVELLRELARTHVPQVSINCVVFGFHAGELKVLLLKWKGVDAWSLPGRYVAMEESLDEVARQVLFSKTGLERVFLQQFHTFSGTTQADAMLWKLLGLRGQPPEHLPLPGRVVTVGYFALVDFEAVEPTPDGFTELCAWHDVFEHPPLAFDQDRMVGMALETLRAQAGYLPIGMDLLPDKFTMPELQALYEAVLGRTLDRRNFQKRVLDLGIVERLPERRRGGAHRSPFLYRFHAETYERSALPVAPEVGRAPGGRRAS